MTLPSNIARYDSVELPDFDDFEYHAARIPPSSTLRAWAKLLETERRRILFAWATWACVRGPRGATNLMADLASAYLFSFEATIQVFRSQFDKEGRIPGSFERWLEDQPSYELECRGLRTLRHLQAHVRPVTVDPRRDVLADTPFAGPVVGGRTAWTWSPLSVSDWESLVRPKIDIAEIDEWNSRCTELLTLGLMLRGVEALRDILLAAEAPEQSA